MPILSSLSFLFILSNYIPNCSSMMSQKASREIAELEKSSSRCSNFLYLFDEKWFFYSALNGRRILPSPVGLNDGDLETTKQSLYDQKPAATAVVKIDEKTASPSARHLIRTPSLPPPRVGCDGSSGQEEEPVPRNNSTCRKLRYSYSSLDAPVQLSISSCSSSKITGRQMPPRTEAPHRRCANPHLVMCWKESNMKAFQNKKWRSLGDLATMELQGFKDLGFVFDEREGLSSSLVRVIPALGEMKREEEGGGVRRFYLPEAWFTQRSAPPMVLRRVGCRSGEEMKEQLRFWARAVACNVRREC